MAHLILCLEQVLFSIPQPVDIQNIQTVDPSTSSGQFNRTACHFYSPELEDVFPLLIVMSHLTHRLSKADGHLSVVWDAIACTFSIFVEAETSFS